MVTLTLPEGSYRFRADYDGVQFWSGQENHCDIPGCLTAEIILPGSLVETNVTIDYTYDGLYRLTAADYSDGTYFQYTYDPVGNRLTQETQEDTTSYAYDIANRLVEVDGVSYLWDDNGNLLFDGESFYNYDYANRLTSVNGAETNAGFAYNGLGDRLQQTVDGAAMTYSLDLNTGLTQVLTDGDTTYLYGLARISQESNGYAEYYLGDALGSVRQLTEGSGALTYAATYTPYGEVLSSAGEGESVYGYTNEYTSQGLIYLRARYYAPGSGRFLSHDAWNGDTNRPMSYNAWLYVYGNPINLVDPRGLFGHGLARFVDGDVNYNVESQKFYEYGSVLNTTFFFSTEEATLIDQATWDVANAYSRAYRKLAAVRLNCILRRTPQIIRFINIQRMDPTSVFLRIHGGRVTFMKYHLLANELGNTGSRNLINIFDKGRLQGQNSYFSGPDMAMVYERRSDIKRDDVFKRFIVHELGHAFDNAINRASDALDVTLHPKDVDLINMLVNDVSVNSYNGFAGTQEMGWQRRANDYRTVHEEVFADMFVGWVYNKWQVDPETQVLTYSGTQRSNFMNEHIGKWIESELGSPISINPSYWP